MKKFLISLIYLCFSVIMVTGCTLQENEILRIHIRANSNLSCDQEIKLLVKDEVVKYITPKISSCSNCVEVKNVLNSNLDNIEKLADQVLKDNGYEYQSNAEIKNEYFPTRDYDGITFPADYYDALIINLGSGKGNNWWCVAYPPLCFVGEDNGTERVEYKSKIVEIISKIFGR